MLLSFDEANLLIPDGEEYFKAKDNLTKTEKKKLLDLDDWYFELYGKHLITNYNKLKD